jgi:serine/threonine-protein kinase HipA
MTTGALDAYLYGTHVARVLRAANGRVELEFTGDALARWGFGSPVLSALLPLSDKGSTEQSARGRVWLQGLLPEGRARTRMAERAGVVPDDLLGFLAAYGRDTTGAVVLVPAGDAPDRDGGHPTPVDDERIGQMLDEAAARGAAEQITSIQGLEAKIVLVRTEGGFALPTPGHPSTHIVKLSRPAGSQTADLIDTECAALDLARRVGVGDVQAHVADFAGRRALVVRRYDRHQTRGRVERIHQEDTAQALGLDTSDPDRKFQHGRALPSLRAIARVMDRVGADTRTLLALTTFNLALGNTDAHAKNISLLHQPDGSITLAPAYDVAMHTHHPHADPRFAMDVAGKRDMAALTGEDLVREAESWGLTPVLAGRVVVETLDRFLQALEEIDHDAHPGVPDQAWSTVHARARRLRDTAPPVRAARTPRPARAPQPRGAKGTTAGGRFLPKVP